MGQNDNKYTQLRLPKAIHQRLKIQATIAGMTMVEFVAKLIEEVEKKKIVLK